MNYVWAGWKGNSPLMGSRVIEADTPSQWSALPVELFRTGLNISLV